MAAAEGAGFCQRPRSGSRPGSTKQQGQNTKAVVSTVRTAGCIKRYIKNWKSITADPYILDMVQHAHIKFNKVRDLSQDAINPYAMSVKEAKLLECEIKKLLSKGVLVEIDEGEAKYLSNVFLRPKKDGSHRMILNLNALNKNIEYKKFKMETLESIITLMTPNCFMCSLDLKDAYYSVPVSLEHQKYLCFPWIDEMGNRHVYAYTCFPNGLTSAPRDFTKLMKPPLTHLRLQGVTIAIYIDDTFIVDQDEAKCTDDTELTRQFLESLGFTINAEKSMQVPSQQLTMLGFILDSVTMEITPTEDKVLKISRLCTTALQKHRMTVRELAQLIGTLVSSFPGVEYGKMHYRSLEKLKSNTLKSNRGNFEAHVELTKEARIELNWWLLNIKHASKKISHGKPTVTIQTDASNMGWGAVRDGEKTGGRWTDTETEDHINCLELRAVLFGLRSLCTDLTRCHIKILADNTTAVCYINEQGGTVSTTCNKIATEIWEWCMHREIWLTAAHIPGRLNIEADVASRTFEDRTDWELDRGTFELVCQKFGRPDIDLFATRLNAKLACYVSWNPDPYASYVDAMTGDWSVGLQYMFPPFRMIGRCARKVLEEMGEAILIVPLWPSQCWFPRVMEMLTRHPVLLPRGCVTPPKHSLANLPKHLVFLACRISGCRSKVAAFLETLPTSYYRAGARPLGSNMNRQLADGQCFVVRGRSIYILRL
jgi:hypothetical protein